MSKKKRLEPYSEHINYILEHKDNEKQITLYSNSNELLLKFNSIYDNTDNMIIKNFEIIQEPNDVELYEINTSFFGMAGRSRNGKIILQKYPFEFELNSKLIEDHVEKIEKTPEYISINLKIPKNCHYVQQAYLRGFTSNIHLLRGKHPGYIRKKARIFCYDKIEQKLLRKGDSPVENEFGLKIETVGSQEYFYSIAFEWLVNKITEQDFSNVRNKIWKEQSVEKLTQNEKILIIEYMLLQWNRTPKARKIIEDMGKKFIKEYIRIYGKVSPNEYVIKMDETTMRNDHESMILDMIQPSSENYVIPYLIYRKMGLLTASNNDIFLTSDNPVIFWNPLFEGKYKKFGKKKVIDNHFHNIMEKYGIKNKKLAITTHNEDIGLAPTAEGLHIYLPITPLLCLYLIDENPYQKVKKLTTNQINNKIIEQAEKYIFSCNNDFKHVEEYIKNNPNCKDLKYSKIWNP